MKIAWCWQKVFLFFPMDPVLPIMEAKTFSTIKQNIFIKIHCIAPFLQVVGEAEIDHYLDNI